MSVNIQVIVGLGNPGAQYQNTRHNAGQDFVAELADAFNISLKQESKFSGLYGKGIVHGKAVHLLIPTTFMNLSGQALQSLTHFYKIPIENVLVAHDELDIPPGAIKLKKGGGHGGNNGLRSIIERCGSKEFARIRIGIGHPGHKSQVSNWVLSKPSQDDSISIERANENAFKHFPDLVDGNWQSAMNNIHSFKL